MITLSFSQNIIESTLLSDLASRLHINTNIIEIDLYRMLETIYYNYFPCYFKSWFWIHIKKRKAFYHWTYHCKYETTKMSIFMSSSISRRQEQRIIKQCRRLAIWTFYAYPYNVIQCVKKTYSSWKRFVTVFENWYFQYRVKIEKWYKIV